MVFIKWYMVISLICLIILGVCIKNAPNVDDDEFKF